MGSKSKFYHLLDPHFDEIKTLILANSTYIATQILNEKYALDITERDLNNYLYLYQSDFNVINHRRANNRFDFHAAKREDRNRSFQPRFR